MDSLIALFEGRSGMRAGSVRLMPTIETVAGLSNVDEIAAASPRTVCLGFGAGDFSLDVGLDWPPASGQLSPTVIGAKAQLVLASRKAGLEPPHDGVYPNFRKPEVLREEAEQSRALGFHGKHAIHPDQVPVILDVYGPSEADVAEARATLEAYERGLEDGIGGVHIDGRFIDYPVAERARRVLAESGEELPSPLPLEGLRVLDISSLYAAPLISANLGDFGATVIKVEHPRGDDARRWGLSKDGVPLWWKTISRNKRVIELDLNSEEGRDVVRRLAADSDVLIENFRPGRLEKWGLGPEELHALNPRLVIVRVTGFGQTGPYSDRPGFGTLAEAFSGFAHMTGLADGPPTLPPFGLADAVCGLAGTYATMIALYWRDAAGGGEGQVIDLSLFEPLFSVLGPQITEFSELGVVQGRQGNRSPRTAPRNAYQTSDGRWVALSGGTQQIVNRMLEAIERPGAGRGPALQRLRRAARERGRDRRDRGRLDRRAHARRGARRVRGCQRTDRSCLRHRPDLGGPALPRARELRHPPGPGPGRDHDAGHRAAAEPDPGADPLQRADRGGCGYGCGAGGAGAPPGASRALALTACNKGGSSAVSHSSAAF